MKRTTALIFAALLLLFAGSASAGVLVYKNNFKKASDFRQIEQLKVGKSCDKEWKGEKTLGVSLSKGKANCEYSTPVQGDKVSPDHLIKAVAKVLKKTNKQHQRSTYVGVVLRTDGVAGYQLKVFPKTRRWEVLRNGSKLGSGREKAIDGLNKKNKLRLAVNGNKVVAKVNGATLVRAKDDKAGNVRGRKTALIFGSNTKSNKAAFGLFDNIRIQVP